MSTKAPSYQWYPDKWLADTRRLSWKAKGLYKDLLDIIWMQFQETCSIPDDTDFIAHELGCTPEDWQKARAEIMCEHRPLMHLETNRLFSNGLYKEHEKQQVRRERLRANGMKGGRPKKQKVSKNKAEKRLSSPTPTPSPTLVKKKKEPLPDIPESLKTPEFQSLWTKWIKHRTEIKKKLEPTSAGQQLKRLQSWGIDRAVAALEHSLAGGFQGIYEDKDKKTKTKYHPDDEPGRYGPSVR